MVSQQLKSFSIESYTEFIRTGYPTRISLDVLNAVYGIYFPRYQRVFNTAKQFYTNLLPVVGFHRNEFKFGENMIFFRNRRSHLLEDLMQKHLHHIKLLSSNLVRSKWNKVFVPFRLYHVGVGYFRISFYILTK